MQTEAPPIIPLISPMTTGPLGVMHLPRVWYKMLLFSYGKLPSEYRHGKGGLDEILLSGLGIDPDELSAFIEREKPDYQACEAWVRSRAKDISPENIAAVNAKINASQVPEPNATKRREQFKISDPTFAHAITIVNLDDWYGMHAALTAVSSRA